MDREKGEHFMWIFSQQGFLSVVKHTDKPETLIVRSRFRGHIEKIFGGVCVLEDPTRDYRFRAELPAKEVSVVIAKMILKIDYENFKACLDLDDQGYYVSCINVYNVVARNSVDWDLDNFVCGREEN
jgi:hypothetical protein